jgi:hypothetical protein
MDVTAWLDGRRALVLRLDLSGHAFEVLLGPQDPAAVDRLLELAERVEISAPNQMRD